MVNCRDLPVAKRIIFSLVKIFPELGRNHTGCEFRKEIRGIFF